MVRLLVFVFAFVSTSGFLTHNTTTPTQNTTKVKSVAAGNATKKNQSVSTLAVSMVVRNPQSNKTNQSSALADLAAAMMPKRESNIDDSDSPESEKDSWARFPTDWMNPKNVMKYDIDNDPMGNHYEKTEDQTEKHRGMNQKPVFAQEFMMPVKGHKTAPVHAKPSK